MSDKITTSLTTLCTGFLVVFAVLLLLILVIKVYGTIVYNLENKGKKTDKAEKQELKKPEPIISQPVESGVSLEVVAAIAAAVDYIYGPKKAVIKSIKKSASQRKAWHTAGVMHNTRPF